MPHDFRNKSFQKVLRGYAPDEVDDYIAYMNEEYRKLERRTADSERKLALALKKLDESAKTGSADSVGPAAREAAAKLLRETEAKRSEILAMTEQQASESAERIVHEAETKAAAMAAEASQQAQAVIAEASQQAGAVVAEAVQQAEAILAEAKAEAEAHRDDVKKAQSTAQTIYDEIGAFREKLFALYNEHLDALDGVTEAAEEFIGGVDAQVPAELPETEDVPEEMPAEELPEEDTDVPDETEYIPDETEPEELPDVPAEDITEEEQPQNEPAEPEELPEESADIPEEPEETVEDAPEEEPAEHPLGDEVASNLAFMDRLFAVLQEETAGEDLYIDIPGEEEESGYGEPADAEASEDFEEDFEDGYEDGYEEDYEEPAGAEDGEDVILEEELPAITIDWKNRSAVSARDAEEYAEEEIPAVSESDDFRSADGFEDFGDEYGDFEPEEESFEENYDDYSPDETVTEENAPAEDDEEDEDAEEEEKDEYHDMDQIFNEDKSKREMSLTDEFNIIFADSKSNQNVKEISRQPIVAPENPKNAKKHKKF